MTAGRREKRVQSLSEVMCHFLWVLGCSRTTRSNSLSFIRCRLYVAVALTLTGTSRAPCEGAQPLLELAMIPSEVAPPDPAASSGTVTAVLDGIATASTMAPTAVLLPLPSLRQGAVPCPKGRTGTTAAGSVHAVGTLEYSRQSRTTAMAPRRRGREDCKTHAARNYGIRDAGSHSCTLRLTCMGQRGRIALHFRLSSL
jgi:hypothetical protein